MMVGLLGLLQGVNIAVEHNLGSIIRNEAVSVADEQMVEAMNAASINDGVTSTGFAALASSTYAVQRKIRGGNYGFTINRTVTSKSTKSKEVTIRVVWTYKSKTLNHQATALIMAPI